MTKKFITDFLEGYGPPKEFGIDTQQVDYESEILFESIPKINIA